MRAGLDMEMTTGGHGKVRGRNRASATHDDCSRTFQGWHQVRNLEPLQCRVRGRKSCISNARRLLVPYMYISGVARLFGRVETSIDDAGASGEDCLPRRECIFGSEHKRSSSKRGMVDNREPHRAS